MITTYPLFRLLNQAARAERETGKACRDFPLLPLFCALFFPLFAIVLLSTAFSLSIQSVTL